MAADAGRVARPKSANSTASGGASRRRRSVRITEPATVGSAHSGNAAASHGLQSPSTARASTARSSAHSSRPSSATAKRPRTAPAGDVEGLLQPDDDAAALSARPSGVPKYALHLMRPKPYQVPMYRKGTLAYRLHHTGYRPPQQEAYQEVYERTQSHAVSRNALETYGRRLHTYVERMRELNTVGGDTHAAVMRRVVHASTAGGVRFMSPVRAANMHGADRRYRVPRGADGRRLRPVEGMSHVLDADAVPATPTAQEQSQHQSTPPPLTGKSQPHVRRRAAVSLRRAIRETLATGSLNVSNLHLDEFPRKAANTLVLQYVRCVCAWFHADNANQRAHIHPVPGLVM